MMKRLQVEGQQAAMLEGRCSQLDLVSHRPPVTPTPPQITPRYYRPYR